MIKEKFTKFRNNKSLDLTYDVCITGGGLAGVCAAIAAARQGSKVALIQDRPVLGGNSSSEVRLWALGATSHMGNNNRWSREGGIIDEILVENVFRNKEGNVVIFDTILIDKVKKERNIDLYLNTIVFEVQKKDEDKIESITAFNPQNSTKYNFNSNIFIDASGDGIVSYLAGAPFRIGAETKDEFDEKFAPDIEEYGELLGHTIYFYSKRANHPVKYTAPSFALKEIEKVTKIRDVKVDDIGTKFWWLEYGGRHDTIHATEEIKYELWKIVYGIWDHIKNSGEYEGAENYTLEWVGTVPGKRESRRFEGEYMINQKDIVEQREHYDAIAYGGWAMDLHPADGVYSKKPPCSQFHSKGIYPIPYRCYVPQKISNLLLAGRIISASHVAFGSTRVMLTSAYGGQAVGVAASLCVKNKLLPHDYIREDKIGELQQELADMGHYIPYIRHEGLNLAKQAEIDASSSLAFKGLEPNGSFRKLDLGMAQLIPCKGHLPKITLKVKCSKKTMFNIELRASQKKNNHTPDLLLKLFSFDLIKGEQDIEIKYPKSLDTGYIFLILQQNEHISVALSDQLVSGTVSVFNKFSPEVNNYGRQINENNIGIDEFEFWTPIRRPNGVNMAFKLDNPLPFYTPENITNGFFRPINEPNAWAAEMDDTHPYIILNWKKPVIINQIKLFFDTDFDHAMETSQWPHPEDRIPFVVKEYKILDGNCRILKQVTDNFQTINEHTFVVPITTQTIRIEFKKWNKYSPVALMGIICK